MNIYSRCCVYVAELEHKFFSKNQALASAKVVPQVKKVDLKNSNDDLTFSCGSHLYDEPEW